MRAVLVLSAVVLLAAGPAFAQSSTATGVSRAFNPAISVNTLLLGRTAHRSDSPDANRFDLQEGEMQFTSVVDPYWKANLICAYGPAGDGYEFGVEVASLESRSVPGGFGLKFGQDHLPFGKHVPLHTHQYPFVDAPLAVSTYLGEEGLSEPGVQVSHEVPLPWYVDVTGYAVDGRSAVFDPESRDPSFGVRWSNLLDLSMTSTLELGGSFLRGPQAPGYLDLTGAADDRGHVQVWGADATWKWVSAGSSRGPAATVTAEMVLPRPDGWSGKPWGWYATGQVRVGGFWWAGLGTGAIDRKGADPQAAAAADALFAWQKAREYKANLTWVPSEFSAVRLEAARYDDRLGDASDTLVSLQFNFTIGSHPAHLY